MKKIIMAILIGLVATSYGVVNVNWSAGAGFYWDPAMDALLSPGGSTIAQLMYSSDNVRDDINLTKAGTVNDVIWGSVTLTEGINTSVYGDFNPLNYQQAFASGYVYALIFQDNNVQGGDWYYHTSLIALEDITGINPAQSLQMNTDLVNGDAINGASSAQVVPEPATVLLLGVGGIMSLILRRMRTA